MKNKRVRFDDRFYFTILSFLLLIGSLLLIVYCTDLPIWGYIALIFTFSLAVTGLYVFPKIGLHFNYKLGVIKYLGPYKTSPKRKIRMDEIKKIDFVEINVPKGRGLVPERDYNHAEDVIYRNGKIYKFVIHLTDSNIIEIPYYELFKALSKKRVSQQEKRINKIIAEFNLFRSNN